MRVGEGSAAAVIFINGGVPAACLPGPPRVGGGGVVLKAHFGKLMVPSLGRRLAAIRWRSTDRTTVVSLSTG